MNRSGGSCLGEGAFVGTGRGRLIGEEPDTPGKEVAHLVVSVRLEIKPFADEKWLVSTLDLGQSENQCTSLDRGGERPLSRACWVPQEPQDRCRGAQTQAGLGPRVG